MVRPIFFLHTPKTAGRTLLHFLQAQFSQEEILYGDWPDITSKVSPRYKLVAGHLYLRDMAIIDFLGHYRITILRDPLEQAVSHYYHMQERLHRDGKIQDYLQRALDDGLSESILNGSFFGSLDTMINHLSSFSFATASREENCGSAKTNLRYFDAIGFMEDYDPFMHALLDKLGIEHREIPVINPPKWKPAEIPLTRQARDLLLRRLEHEYWLYHYAQRTFGPFRV